MSTSYQRYSGCVCVYSPYLPVDIGSRRDQDRTLTTTTPNPHSCVRVRGVGGH